MDRSKRQEDDLLLKLKVLFEKLDPSTSKALPNPSLDQLITLIEKKAGYYGEQDVQTMEALIETLEAKLKLEQKHSKEALG